MYCKFEEAFLRWTDTLNWKEIAQQNESSELQTLRTDLAETAAQVEKADKALERMAGMLTADEEPPATLISQLKQTESRKDGLLKQQQSLQKRLDDQERKQQPLADVRALRDSILSLGDLDSRLRLRNEIRRRVSRIDCSFGDREFPVVRVTFSNGQSRFMVFGRKEVSTFSPDTEKSVSVDSARVGPHERLPGESAREHARD